MKYFRHFTQALLFSLLVVAPALAACPSWPTTTRFRFSADGAEVTDTRTNLIWARCSVGQTWSGTTCTDTASTLTHEAALTTAQGETDWRLPNIMELASLADRGCQSPALDKNAFPNAPVSAGYWSSSPYVGSGGQAWLVDFNDGFPNHSARSDLKSLRLLRVNP